MSNNKLTLKQNDYEKIIDHCCSEQPYEACGIVSGVNDIVSSIWKLKNESKSLNRYFVSNEKVQNVFDEIFNKGENVLGIYHSHPIDKAYPSPEDIAFNNYPEIAQIIISFARSSTHPDVKCFYLKGSRVIPLKVEKINENN